MVENAIVTGASGFIGTRLVRRLAREGRFGVVRAVDIEPPRERLPGVAYLTQDVRLPLPDATGEGVSTIYNLAAVHRTPGHPPNEYYETNIEGALNVTDLAARCGAQTIVFTSSISVYGPSEAVITEHARLAPTSHYGRSKRMAERLHRAWRAQDPARRLVTVRPGVVFGPGERGNYTRLANALRGGYFVYPGRTDTVKSGGYVDELLATFDFALKRNEPEVLYNFAYPAESTTADIVQAFVEVGKFRSVQVTVPGALLMVAATGFEVLNALGLKNSIHRERVQKLMHSTRIQPDWLETNGYTFQTDLRSALQAWSEETHGAFA